MVTVPRRSVSAATHASPGGTVPRMRSLSPTSTVFDVDPPCPHVSVRVRDSLLSAGPADTPHSTLSPQSTECDHDVSVVISTDCDTSDSSSWGSSPPRLSQRTLSTRTVSSVICVVAASGSVSVHVGCGHDVSRPSPLPARTHTSSGPPSCPANHVDSGAGTSPYPFWCIHWWQPLPAQKSVRPMWSTRVWRVAGTWTLPDRSMPTSAGSSAGVI